MPPLQPFQKNLIALFMKGGEGGWTVGLCRPNKYILNFCNIGFLQGLLSLIDNIFSNIIDPDIISANLTATISDHPPQFAIIPNMFGNTTSNKSDIYERDWSKFDEKNLF